MKLGSDCSLDGVQRLYCGLALFKVSVWQYGQQRSSACQPLNKNSSCSPTIGGLLEASIVVVHWARAGASDRERERKLYTSLSATCPSIHHISKAEALSCQSRGPLVNMSVSVSWFPVRISGMCLLQASQVQGMHKILRTLHLFREGHWWGESRWKSIGLIDLPYTVCSDHKGGDERRQREGQVTECFLSFETTEMWGFGKRAAKICQYTA